MAGEEEGDEAVLVRGSPQLGWWQRGGATAMDDGGRKLHIARAPEGGGRRCGVARGWRL
jgi:hypothetical protein